MANNQDTNQDDLLPLQEEGNLNILSDSNARHYMNLAGNCSKTYIKYTCLRAGIAARSISDTIDNDNSDIQHPPEREENQTEEMSAEGEEEESVSSSILRSPEVVVPSLPTPRGTPRTPTKEAGAESFRTPERFGNSVSSPAVSEVRRTLMKNMNMTGSTVRRREEQRDAAEERRKVARDRQLGRDLLLPDPSLPRQRRNSAPSLFNAAGLQDNNGDITAMESCSRHPSGEEGKTDPNAPAEQRVATPAPGQYNPTVEQELAATAPMASEENNRFLPPTPQQEEVPKGVAKSATAEGKPPKKGRRSDRRGGRRNKNKKEKTAPTAPEQGAEEPGPSGVQHPGDVFVLPSPVATLTITREGTGNDGLVLVAQTLFQVPVDFLMTNPIRPVPDGAILDVCDQASAEAVATALRGHGWTVVVTPIWPRYEFVAPALLAGTGPNDQGPSLNPLTIVRGLTTRNRNFGLPQDALRFVSSTWEEVRGEGEREGQTLQRLRIWVDVSPEGEDFLRGHSFLLRTLSNAVRLRPAPRNRQRPDRS